MPVSTIKFSQFALANLNTSTNRVAGISAATGGVNTISPVTVTWTTTTRPATPYNGLLGYNTTTDLYEYWDVSLNQWTQLTTGGGTVTPVEVQENLFNSGVDTGIADAYVVALTPPIVLSSHVFYVIFTPTHNNLTSTPTLNVNGTGALLITLSGGDNIAPDDLVTTQAAICYYNPALNQYILLNPFTSNTSIFNVQTSAYISSDDIGAVNAYEGNYLSLNPALENNQILVINNLTATNTGASTFFAGTLPVKPIVSNTTLSALVGGEMIAGGSYMLVYNSTLLSWVLMNPDIGGGGVTAAQIQKQTFVYYADSGVANVYAFTPSPAPGSLTDGLEFEFTAAHANTGASTVNIGLGANNIYYNGNTAIALAANAIIANGRYKLSYSTALTGWLLLNPSASILSAHVPVGGGGVSLTNSTPVNITTLSLPAGLWECDGNSYVAAGSAAITQYFTWASTTSATVPNLSQLAVTYPNGGSPMPQSGLVTPKQFITGPATVYLSVFVGFTGSCTGYGNLYAKLITS